MTKTFRTNLFVLGMMLNQILMLFILPILMYYLPIGTIGLMILPQLLTFILPIIIFFYVTKEPIIETLSIKPLAIKNVVLIILLSFLIQPLMSLLSSITALIFPNPVSALFAELGDFNITMLMLGMAVMPAICEELFFRGVTFSGYQNLSLLKSCLLTGLLFGMMHLDGQQFLYAFVMGAIFCFLVYKTKSIFSSILAHFTINASQTFLAAYTLSGMSESEFNAWQALSTNSNLSQLHFAFNNFLKTLPLLLIAVGIFLYLNHEETIDEITEYTMGYSKTSLDHSDQNPPEKILNLPLILIFILYILFLIIFS